MTRVISWFSCGAASAYATYLASKKYKNINAVYCRVRNEHKDNMVFLKQFENKTGIKIEIIENKDFDGDIYNVFRKRGFIKNQFGAPCTMLLKREMRYRYQEPDDIQIFGFPVGEEGRSIDLQEHEPELNVDEILITNNISKEACKQWVFEQGFDIPEMYKLGYTNNNCIGCVKGAMGYWNAIRKDFPDIFDKMASLERELEFAINKDKNGQVFLDELEPSRGNFKRDMPSSCGFMCDYENPLKELSND